MVTSMPVFALRSGRRPSSTWLLSVASAIIDRLVTSQARDQPPAGAHSLAAGTADPVVPPPDGAAALGAVNAVPPLQAANTRPATTVSKPSRARVVGFIASSLRSR